MTTVYSRPDCIQCDRTITHLTRKGRPFDTVDVTTDPDAYQHITETLGYRQAPVVVTDTGQHWSGYRPDKIAALASASNAPDAAELSAGPTIPAAYLGH